MFEAKIPMECRLTNEVIGTAVRKQLGWNLGSMKDVDLEQVRELNLFGENVIEIEELTLLPNLETLTLGGFGIKDFKNLSKLKKLRALSIHQMKVPTLEPLLSLENLEKLVLHSVQSTDFRDLSQMHGLKALSLACTDFWDTTVLGELTGLVSLDLSQTAIQSLKGLGTLEGLRELKLGDYQICEEDAICLSNLARLECLHAARCRFGDGLERFQSQSLRELVLFGSTLGSLGFLAQLPALEKLNLDKSSFHQQQSFPAVRRLKTLSLGLCKVDRVLLDGIGRLEGLEELTLDQSGIQDVTPLSKLYHLKRLSIASNGISALSGISRLKQLEYLNASNNRIAEVDADSMGKLAELKYLNLSYNRNIPSLRLTKVPSRITLVADEI